MTMSNYIMLDGVEVSDGSEPYLIGEIGINHNGDIQIAKRLIDAANACGWNAVKFQKRVPEIAVPESQKNVMRDTPWGRMTYLEYKKKIEFGKEEFDYIDNYCRQKPISWSASPWDMPSLEFLLQYDVPFIKIASATFVDDELIIEATKSGKAIILSTGMSEWSEIDHAVDILDRYATGGYILMHTNSAYPAKCNSLNLNVIKAFKDRYRCLVGYSGHEENVEPTVIAVMLGACVIERHITLSREMWGTDQKSSLEVDGMFKIKKDTSLLKESLGNGERVMSDDEKEARIRLRGI